MENPTFEEIDILVATPGALGKLSAVGVYKLGEVSVTYNHSLYSWHMLHAEQK